MKDKKPFRDTKVGKFLKEKFPNILDAAAGLTGIDALEVVADLIKGEDINPTDKIELQKLILQEMELELENVKSARQREADVVQATGKPDYAQWTVGLVGLLLASAVICYGVFSVEIKYTEIYFHILGVIEGALLLPIFNYYFGSSLGSKTKEKNFKDLIR